LTPASGCQAHTTSPSASPVFAKKASPGKGVVRLSAPSRPPHPASTSVTIASRPSCETGWRGLVEMICPTGKVENIFERDWTAQIRLNGFKKFNFWRNAGASALVERSDIARSPKSAETGPSDEVACTSRTYDWMTTPFRPWTRRTCLHASYRGYVRRTVARSVDRPRFGLAGCGIGNTSRMCAARDSQKSLA
jgi:hypothetical protein